MVSGGTALARIMMAPATASRSLAAQSARRRRPEQRRRSFVETIPADPSLDRVTQPRTIEHGAVPAPMALAHGLVGVRVGLCRFPVVIGHGLPSFQAGS